MINANMRLYDYYLLDEENAYGQIVSTSIGHEPEGQIKMAINISSQSIQDNINYSGCQYVGLTQANVDDTYIIDYGNELLKVLYVNPKGRMKQVFMARM